MTKEAQKKIWKSLAITLGLGIAAIIVGLMIHFLGLGRKLVLLELCAFVFGGLAIGMAVYKVAKFSKFVRNLDD